MSVEMFVNLPFRRQFGTEKYHFKTKIKVDIKWNVKTEWLSISKISPFLNSLPLKLFSKCGMKAISSSFHPDWHHATFILWPSTCQRFWPVLALFFCEGGLQNLFSQCLGIGLPTGEAAFSAKITETQDMMKHSALSGQCSCLVQMSTLERDGVAISPEWTGFFSIFYF